MKILCSNSIRNIQTRFNKFLRTPKTIALVTPITITITGFSQKLQCIYWETLLLALPAEHCYSLTLLSPHIHIQYRFSKLISIHFLKE